MTSKTNIYIKKDKRVRGRKPTADQNVSMYFTTIHHATDPTISLTFLHQSGLWIFSRSSHNDCLFMRVLGRGNPPINSLVKFKWQPEHPRMMDKKRHYYFRDFFGIIGHYYDMDGESYSFMMKRGRRMYWCPTDNKWKDAYAPENESTFWDLVRHNDDAVLNLIVDTTHNAVLHIQKWWRYQTEKIKVKSFNILKMAEFNQMKHGLGEDCVLLIEQHLTLLCQCKC